MCVPPHHAGRHVALPALLLQLCQPGAGHLHFLRTPGQLPLAAHQLLLRLLALPAKSGELITEAVGLTQALLGEGPEWGGTCARLW